LVIRLEIVGRANRIGAASALSDTKPLTGYDHDPKEAHPIHTKFPCGKLASICLRICQLTAGRFLETTNIASLSRASRRRRSDQAHSLSRDRRLWIKGLTKDLEIGPHVYLLNVEGPTFLRSVTLPLVLHVRRDQTTRQVSALCNCFEF